MNKWSAYFRFAVQHRKISIALIIILTGLLACDWLSGWHFLDSVKTRWDDDINQLVTFATFFVAIAVWIAELAQEWRNQLPKRLSVDFVYKLGDDFRTVMKCERAHLSDTADIRALGQQIGLQLVPIEPPQKLRFRVPYVTQSEGIIEHCKNIGFFRHYQVTFTLTSLPDDLNAEECKRWIEPFDRASISICPP